MVTLLSTPDITGSIYVTGQHAPKFGVYAFVAHAHPTHEACDTNGNTVVLYQGHSIPSCPSCKQSAIWRLSEPIDVKMG